MIITKVGLGSIMKDNDVQYMKYIIRIIKGADPEANVVIMKGSRTYSYNVTPSSPNCRQALIEGIVLAHQILGVSIEFSKTLGIATSIAFELA